MTTENEMLNEILLKPSNEIKADRFAEQDEAAGCNGLCATGTCRSLV